MDNELDLADLLSEEHDDKVRKLLFAVCIALRREYGAMSPALIRHFVDFVRDEEFNVDLQTLTDELQCDVLNSEFIEHFAINFPSVFETESQKDKLQNVLNASSFDTAPLDIETEQVALSHLKMAQNVTCSVTEEEGENVMEQWVHCKVSGDLKAESELKWKRLYLVLNEKGTLSLFEDDTMDSVKGTFDLTLWSLQQIVHSENATEFGLFNVSMQSSEGDIQFVFKTDMERRKVINAMTQVVEDENENSVERTGVEHPKCMCFVPYLFDDKVKFYTEFHFVHSQFVELRSRHFRTQSLVIHLTRR